MTKFLPSSSSNIRGANGVDPVIELADGFVRHERLRPARHAFAYRVPFLQLRIDRLVDQNVRLPRLFSRDRFNLFSIRTNDYLFGDGTLLDKIGALLKAHGIDDVDGPVHLQTFPRVLGYAFNPVSFWFCRRSDGSLRAIVAEVNNTFGERHCYLLAHSDGNAIKNGQSLNATKVFHVSPFCRVAGEYRFRFLERREPSGARRVIARIDYSDLVGDLVLTSIAGELTPASCLALLATFARRPMFTFMVVARIHYQALRLWLKRVPWFSKPAPPSWTVTR
ncbi:MAG TPA: DUF1365 domain-containing protein [Burkholderiaceae bacterium]|nr:DUF1365 domain-containing protein [Burkholderiaceae bacterium]